MSIQKDPKQQIEEDGIEPVFDQQTPKVDKFTGDMASIGQLISELDNFVHHNKYLSLAGLAANQVQKHGERVMLNACWIMNPEIKKFTIAINPVILSKSGTSLRSPEGCLTWPKKKVIAIRHETVEVEYYDYTTAQNIKRTVNGYEAIIWQHEVDHLNGVQEELQAPIVSEKKVGQNDPCPCGKLGNDGKPVKYKKCHGR